MKRSRLGRGNPASLKPKTCATCGVEFQPRIGFQKYCGPACRFEAEIETFSCLHCGVEFRRARSAGACRFCSSTCSNKANGPTRQNRGPLPPKFAICAGCGKEFVKKSRSVRHCSRACAMRHRHRVARESAPPKWGITAKREEGCRNCGRFASHLHHIVPRSKSRLVREDIEGNGLPLCFDCHRGWHDRRVVIYHDILTDKEFATAVEFGGAVWVERNYPDREHIALQRLDELVRNRRLFPDRAESVDERIRRTTNERMAV